MRIPVVVAAVPLGIALLLSSCIRPIPAPLVKQEVHVAAAANLSRVLEEINLTFERNTQVHVIASYGATAQLEQQIESGAPYDVFMAADVTHVDDLVKKGLAPPESKEIYVKGRLALYAPRRRDIHTLQDLVHPRPLEIFVAKPELAPYGAAAVEALKAAGLWTQLEPHTKYAANITAAMQYADTGNCDAAITALSLVYDKENSYLVIDESLHKPILQAMCIMKNSKKTDLARLYTSYMSSLEARASFKKFGYGR